MQVSLHEEEVSTAGTGIKWNRLSCTMRSSYMAMEYFFLFKTILRISVLTSVCFLYVYSSDSECEWSFHCFRCELENTTYLTLFFSVLLKIPIATGNWLDTKMFAMGGGGDRHLILQHVNIWSSENFRMTPYNSSEGHADPLYHPVVGSPEFCGFC